LESSHDLSKAASTPKQFFGQTPAKIMGNSNYLIKSAKVAAYIYEQKDNFHARRSYPHALHSVSIVRSFGQLK
jgi:hypothetical protein